MVTLNDIMQKHGIKRTSEFAKVLSPTTRDPYRAMMRLLKGETDLTVPQLYAIAKHLGKEVSEILF